MSTEDSTPIDEKDSTPIDVQVNNEEVEEDLSYPQPLQVIILKKIYYSVKYEKSCKRVSVKR